jgi:type II secretory pathway component PulF
MPRYSYIAKPQPDRTTEGYIEADSEQEAINKLSHLGYFIVSLTSEEPSLSAPGLFSFPQVSNRQIVLFTRQLSTLLESGVNILKSLMIISGQTRNNSFRAVLNDIISKIKDGAALSDSLQAYPKIFSGLYSSLVRTGEASGNINKSLSRLADFLESEEEFKNSLRSSLIYPFFILSVGIITVIVLLVFVIPRLVAMFEDMGQVLPLPTLILINISSFLNSYWWLILTALLGSVFFLRRVYRTPAGKMYLDRSKLNAALFGPIIMKSEIARLMRTLSLLFSSGLPIITSLEIAATIVQNQVLKSELQGFKEQITSGTSLSVCFNNSQLFPEFVRSIITIGEETGKLDSAFLRIAMDYEKDVDRITKSLVRLIEPVIILILGLVVGFIVISMLLPIFQINLMVR